MQIQPTDESEQTEQTEHTRSTVQKLHIRFFGRIKMNPDIRMVKCGDNECSCRIEADCSDPQKKEAKNIHAVACETKYSLSNKGYITVARVEMISARSPLQSKVSLYAVPRVNPDQTKDLCARSPRQDRQPQASPIHPGQA